MQERDRKEAILEEAADAMRRMGELENDNTASQRKINQLQKSLMEEAETAGVLRKQHAAQRPAVHVSLDEIDSYAEVEALCSYLKQVPV